MSVDGGDSILANYGYQDGSGDFFITVDTEKCARCKEKSCVAVCPAAILEIFVDDYDDEVVGVKAEERKKIKEFCSPCKPVTGERHLPCREACERQAIVHSW